jgi:FkbM family methyltransferase
MEKITDELIRKIGSLHAKEQRMVLSYVNKNFKVASSNISVDSKNQFEIQLQQAATLRSLIGSHSDSIFVNSRNGLLAVDPEDMEVGQKLRIDGEYGIAELERIMNFINVSSNVLIIGAHIGAFVIPISKVCKNIVAIEANPASFRLLELNIKINSIDNCTLFNVAASDLNGKIKFLQNRINSGGSKRKPKVDNYIYTYDDPQEILIDAMPLDQLLCGHKFDLVLMDIEGSEYFALKGMQSLLKDVSTLIFEFVPHHFRNVSGVSIEDFVETIRPFKSLILPSQLIEVSEESFLTLLTYLFENDIVEDGIILRKA